MAYAALDSPLPNLTLLLSGCGGCGGREGIRPGLGDLLTDLPLAPIDTVATSVYADPLPYWSTDTFNLPMPTISPSSDLMNFYPPTIGTEFILQGAGQYLNIQTGQIVPMSTAQAITSATTGSASSAAQTQSTDNVANLVDPTTGQKFSGALTTAAQVLKSSGQLVNAAGQLTAAGQALAKQNNLVTPSIGADFTAAISSLTSWFSGSTLILGVPNAVVLGGGFIAVAVVLPMLFSSRKTRRRRR